MQIKDINNARFVGISFGGLVALKIAEKSYPKNGLYLIGAISDQSELRFPFNALIKVHSFIPEIFYNLKFMPKMAVQFYFGIHEEMHTKLFKEMASKISPKNVKSLIHLIRSAKLKNSISYKRVHGNKDKIIKTPKNTGDKVISGGHLISMTNSEEINEWMISNAFREKIIQQCKSAILELGEILPNNIRTDSLNDIELNSEWALGVENTLSWLSENEIRITKQQKENFEKLFELMADSGNEYLKSVITE